MNFQIKATLLWTIGDFLAYEMLSGWSIHGKFACPICVEHTKAFILHYLGKFSWFDCHRRLLDLAHPLKHNKQTISNKYNKKEGPCHAPISLDTRILISLLIFIRNKSSCHFSLFFQHCLIWIKSKICNKVNFIIIS